MLRTSFLASALLVASIATAADLPKDISPEARLEFLRRIKPRYAEAVAEWKGKAEDAKVLMKFKDTEKDGKAKLAQAEARLSALEKSPWQVKGSGVTVIGEYTLKAGDIGIVSVLGQFQGTKTEQGTFVEGVVDAREKKVVRFLVASPFELPKQVKGKKDVPLNLSGLWYVAGFTTIKENEVPVLYRFELTKEERESLNKK